MKKIGCFWVILFASCFGSSPIGFSVNCHHERDNERITKNVCIDVELDAKSVEGWHSIGFNDQVKLETAGMVACMKEFDYRKGEEKTFWSEFVRDETGDFIRCDCIK